MTSQGARTYRVVQWATGNIGAQAAKAVINHPRMQLVGLWVHSDGKAGKDAGEVLGLGRKIGVTATQSIVDIIAAKPDCVLYMPQVTVIDDICRLLESGVNIATSVVEFHDPDSLEPAMRARIEAACKKGKTALHSTGSSPGFISEIFPIALMSMVRRLDCLTIDEYGDMTSRDSPGLIFDVLGYGKPATAVNEHTINHIRDSFGEALRATAKALSMPIDRIEAIGELGVAKKREIIAAGVIEAGTVAGTRITVECYRADKCVMRFRANWYVTKDLEQDWDLGDSGWRVRVEGDPPIEVKIGFPCSVEEYPLISPGFTAYPTVNAIPAICAAEPGIRTAAELKVISILG